VSSMYVKGVCIICTTTWQLIAVVSVVLCNTLQHSTLYGVGGFDNMAQEDGQSTRTAQINDRVGPISADSQQPAPYAYPSSHSPHL
jgi:hypothetical protein